VHSVAWGSTAWQRVNDDKVFGSTILMAPAISRYTKGVFVSSFSLFLLVFGRSKKLDDPKSEKLEAHVYELLSFSDHPAFGSPKS
jgi:hypothetical protein